MVEIKNGQTPEKVVQDHAPKDTEQIQDEKSTADVAEQENMPDETAEAAPEGMSGESPDGETEEGVTQEQPEGDAAEEAAAKDKKRGIRKKQKKDKKDEKIEELNDRLIRNLAEFENFRNRSEKEKSAMFDMGAKSVVEKILPVVDNLERGFEGLSDEEKETPFVKGIEAVYKQIQTIFEELGVTPIEAVGQEFDPNIHNAVMHDEDDSETANQVIEEFQKGYLYKDSVVRHSMVKVLN